MTMMHRRKFLEAGKIVFINLFVLVVLLSMTEIVLRTFFPVHLSAIGNPEARNSQLYGWGFDPGEIISVLDPDTGQIYRSAANSRGWRDVEHQIENSKGTFRILVLGDSVTFGAIVPAELTYPRVMQKLLQEQGLNVEVISIAYGGWGTDQELEALINEGIQYQPDLVIVQFCTNDLTDNNYYSLALQGWFPERLGWKPFYYTIEAGMLVRYENPLFGVANPIDIINTRGMLYSVIRRVELLKYAYKAYSILTLREDKIGNQGSQGSNKPTMEATQFSVSKNQIRMLELNTNIDPNGSFYEFLKQNIGRSITRDELMRQLDASEVKAYSLVVLRILEKRWFHQYWHEEDMVAKKEDGNRYEWQLYQALIRQMKSVSDEIGAKLIVLPETEISSLDWELSWYRTENSEQNRANYLSHLKVIEELMTKIGVTVIQPTRRYTRARNDPHSNAEGNNAMGQDITDFLLRTELNRMRKH
jgi:lysophospholipase L1-like esterase